MIVCNNLITSERIKAVIFLHNVIIIIVAISDQKSLSFFFYLSRLEFSSEKLGLPRNRGFAREIFLTSGSVLHLFQYRDRATVIEFDLRSLASFLSSSLYFCLCSALMLHLVVARNLQASHDLRSTIYNAVPRYYNDMTLASKLAAQMVSPNETTEKPHNCLSSSTRVILPTNHSSS